MRFTGCAPVFTSPPCHLSHAGAVCCGGRQRLTPSLTVRLGHGRYCLPSIDISGVFVLLSTALRKPGGFQHAEVCLFVRLLGRGHPAACLLGGQLSPLTEDVWVER